MVDADWSVTRSNGNIRYIGQDHIGGSLITAGSFAVGTYYEIRTIGTTDYTLIGAASNTVGVKFVATGVGSGTGTAKQAASYATVLEFHRWLQDFADQEISSGDDEHDITDPTSSDRATDNLITLLAPGGGVIYNIDAAAAEHLYDGSIVQRSGDEIYDGIVNFGNATVVIQILQDGAIIADDYWNYAAGGQHDGAADATVLTDSGESWATDEWAGYVIVNTSDGSKGIIASNTATTITLTADGLNGGTDNDFDVSDNYLIAAGLNADASSGISHRFLIRTRADGTDIDQRKLIGTNRTFTRTFGEFKINATSRGNNVLALSDSGDLNNTTDESTVAGWTAITNTEGFRLIDISGDGTDEEYYSEWNRDTFTINQFYERMKWLVRDGSGSTLHGANGELFRGITHEIVYDGETGVAPTTNDILVWGTKIDYDNESAGPFTVGEAIHENSTPPAWKGRILAIDDNTSTGSLIVDVRDGTVTNNEAFTGQTSGAGADVNLTPTAVTGGGSMKVLAIDDNGTTGEVYVQIDRGGAPSNDVILYNAQTNTAAIDVANVIVVNVTVTERAISTPFIGQSTGSALIGAYGVGMESADASSSDIFTDLGNNTINPPNNVTFTVLGLISDEDRVLVTNDNGGAPDFTQLTLDTALTAAGQTTISVQPASIPADTPSTGFVRVTLDDGRRRRVAYTAVDTNDFTTASTSWVNPDDAGISNGVMIAYIDELASGTNVSAGSFTTDVRYRIVTVGTTDFTLIGASSNTVGVVFTATGAGSGTGTADTVDVSASFTTVFNADRTLFIRVRDGGSSPIKTFETTGTLSSTGGSVTAIRTSDA
jgi:hypothetical protein